MLAERYRKELEKRVSRQKEGDRLLGDKQRGLLRQSIVDYHHEELNSQIKYDKLADRLDNLGLYRSSKAIRLIADTEKVHAEILKDLADQLRVIEPSRAYLETTAGFDYKCPLCRTITKKGERVAVDKTGRDIICPNCGATMIRMG